MRQRFARLLFVLSMVVAAQAYADLTVGLMPAYDSIPLAVAAEKGLFAVHGVTVDLVAFSGQLERETALQTGALDGTVSDLINAIQSASHGFGARVTSVTEGNFALLSSPGGGIATMADWKARGNAKVRTGLLENSLVYYLTEAILRAAGADPARIELVPIVQLPARLEMLLAGKIDAACLPEPLATLAAAKGAHRIGDSAGLGATPGVLLFTRKALAGKPREITAFYAAYDAAVDELNAHPESYRAAIVARCGFPPPVAGLMRIPRFHHAFLPPETLVADVADWMKGKGLVEQSPGYADLVAPGFLDDDAGAP